MQAAQRAIAELRQSLQQERDKIGAMARDLASARRPMDQRAPPGRAPDIDESEVQVTQTAGAAVTKQPMAADARDKASARLIARAGALLSQGNIGAARIVLERAAESGNAQASFMLAETYDPVILSAWGTYGTRGEAAKARELYAKAHSRRHSGGKGPARRIASVRGSGLHSTTGQVEMETRDEHAAKTTLVSAARRAGACYPDASIGRHVRAARQGRGASRPPRLSARPKRKR